MTSDARIISRPFVMANMPPEPFIAAMAKGRLRQETAQRSRSTIERNDRPDRLWQTE